MSRGSGHGMRALWRAVSSHAGCLTVAALALAAAPSARADAVAGLVASLTNNVTPAPAPAATNPPPAITNEPPRAVTNAVTPLPGPSGATVGALFLQTGQGKFSVAGRVLALPAREPLPTNAPATDWRRAIDVGMNMTKGNSDTLRYTLALDAVRERSEDLVRFHAQSLYGKSEDATDTENTSVRSRYERQLTARTYALGYADWLTDRIADIDYRVTAIVSPGWHLLRSPQTILSLETGAGHLEEKKQGNRTGYAAGRMAASVERLLNAHVLAWSAAEYIPKFADTSVFFINAEAGIVSMLARNLSMKVTVEDRYDNAPSPGTGKNDLHFSTALSLNF